MSLDDRDYMHADAAPNRTRSGSFSGLRWELEEQDDDCSLTDTVVGGAIGYGVSLVLGFSPLGRFLSVAAGAFTACAARKYHLNLDWDPDRYRGDRAERDDRDRRAPQPEPR